MLNTHNIVLDIKRFSKNRVVLVAGDTGNRFVIAFTDDGSPITFTDSTPPTLKAVVAFKRSDCKTILQDSSVDGNGVSFTSYAPLEVTVDVFSSSFTAGTNSCEVQIYSTATTDFDTLVTSAKFEFFARSATVDEESTQGSKEFPVLQAMIDLVKNMTVAASTLATGSSATATLSVVGGAYKLSLGVPAGADGADGTDGMDGMDGTDGTDGQEVTLRKTDTHIQWQLGSGEWQNLVALSDITPDVSGFVPTTRKVNNKPLSSDITLNATDVGADATGTASSAVSTHDESSDAHSTLMAGKANLVNLGTDGDNSWNSSPLLNNAIGVGTLYTMTDCDEFKPLILATETASGGIVQYAFDGECCGIFMRDGGFISGSTISWGDWLDVATGYTVSSHNTSSTAHSTLMASKVPKSGTTMTGALNARTLGRGQSYGANEFVPKSYVDAAIAAALSSSGESSSGKT